MKKGSKAWEKMVTHARDCSLEGKPELKSYPVAQTNVVLIFDCVNSLVGAWFGDSYIASDSLSSAQQVHVLVSNIVHSTIAATMLRNQYLGMRNSYCFQN